MTQLEEIQQAEHQHLQARLAGDAHTLARLLADELVFVGPDGQTFTKEMDLQTHRSGTMHLSSLVANEPQIELLPSLAVVTVEVDLQGVWAEQSIGAISVSTGVGVTVGYLASHCGKLHSSVQLI